MRDRLQLKELPTQSPVQRHPILKSRPFGEIAPPLKPPQLQRQAEEHGNAHFNLSQISVFPRSQVQARLTIGSANDAYEQEADRVASQVMQTNTNQPIQPQEEEKALQRSPLAATTTPLVQRETLPAEEKALQARGLQRDLSEEAEEPLQAKASGAVEATADLENQLTQTQGAGSSLPAATRAFMEPRFGHDFSQVRVHTDSTAVQMSQAIGAQAFTHGSDIYFNAGKYDPDSQAGKELLAHELTHVVQQTGASAPQKQATPAPHAAVLQARLNWNRADLEKAAGKKSFRSEEYKNIVRIVHNYNRMMNPLPGAHIRALQELLQACVAWFRKNKDKTSEKTERRRQALQRLAADVTQELARLQALAQPVPAQPARSGNALPRTANRGGYANMPLDLLNPNAYANTPADWQQPDNHTQASDFYANMPPDWQQPDGQALGHSPNADMPRTEGGGVLALGPASTYVTLPAEALEALMNEPDTNEPDTEEEVTEAENQVNERLAVVGEIPANQEQEDVDNTAPVSAEASQQAAVVLSMTQAEKEDKLRPLGITWDEDIWWIDRTMSVEASQVDALLAGLMTIEDLRSQIFAPASEDSDDALSDAEEPLAPPKSMAPKDKALRYQDRALTLVSDGKLVYAAMQYTRAFACDSLIEYAFKAAQAFDLGGDEERATTWYRKVIGLDSGSAFAQQARQYLSHLGLGETAKYETSPLYSDANTNFTGVRFDDWAIGEASAYDHPDKDEKRRRKESGLGKEEIVSGTASMLLESYGDKLIAAENSGNLAMVDFYTAAIRKMATGLDIQALIQEHKDYRNGLISDRLLYQQLQGFQVEYLSTTAARNQKRLFYEGMLKQGLPPRSPEAENGYDTTNLSTNFSGVGYAIFVMSGDGAIYADQHKVSQFHHSSFLAGADAAASGEIKVTTGSLKGITNKSGHYRQGARHLAQVLKELQNGLNQSLSGVQVKFFSNDNKSCLWPGDAAAFLQDYNTHPDIFLKSMQEIKDEFALLGKVF